MSTNNIVSLVKEDKVNFEKEIMTKVKSGKIAMKPKWYFVAGSIFMFLGTIAVTVIAVFFINLTIFLLRKQGPGYGKIAMMFGSFPFWIPLLAISGIGLGIVLLRKYDFSYKKNFFVIILGFIASIIAAGFYRQLEKQDNYLQINYRKVNIQNNRINK